MDKIFKIKKKNKMVEIQDGQYSSGLYKKGSAPPICLDAPVHKQHKESMLCQTMGVSICPHMFDCPLYVWMPPYVWMPHMLGCPHV